MNVNEVINGDIATIIDFLKEKNLILSEPPNCNNCYNLMVWQNRNSVCDKFTWRCTKCSSYTTIRKHSFFSLFRTSLSILIKLILYWAIQTPQIVQTKLLQISRNTIISFQQSMRLIAIRALNKDNVVLGGNGMVVEVDESLFIKVKHHKGKDLKR